MKVDRRIMGSRSSSTRLKQSSQYDVQQACMVSETEANYTCGHEGSKSLHSIAIDECDQVNKLGKIDRTVDNISIDSNNSGDTLVTFALMKTYQEDTNVKTEMDEDKMSLCQDDIINTIAHANCRNDILYDIDTIGYYIGHGCDSYHDNTNESVITVLEDKGVDIEQLHDIGKTLRTDPFEEFKHVYGTNIGEQKKCKIKHIARKHTLVLTKVGKQYKYIAIPAYLPGQKTYNTRSEFTKGYIERATNIYRIKHRSNTSKWRKYITVCV